MFTGLNINLAGEGEVTIIQMNGKLVKAVVAWAQYGLWL